MLFLEPTLRFLIAVALRLFFWRKFSRPYALIRDPTIIFQNIFQSLRIFKKMKYVFLNRYFYLVFVYISSYFLLYQSSFNKAKRKKEGFCFTFHNSTVIQYIATPYAYFPTKNRKSLRLLGTLRQFGTLEYRVNVQNRI